MPPITMKGISREVVPYAVHGLISEMAQRPHVISEQGKGVELFLDLDVIDRESAERTKKVLEGALVELGRKAGATNA